MEKKPIFLAKYIPNTITLLSLCCGLSSIRFSIVSEWKTAVLLIIFSGILDFFDGWFAKKLRGEGSTFGAELDSLSDVISFGVAPGLLIYLWSSYELGSLGWSVSLFFVVCSALRLARFTADIYLAPKTIDSSTYFTGVPSPAAAGLILLPLFIFFEFEFSIFKNQYLNFLNILIIGFLMISKIPTISIKKINFDKKYNAWVYLILVFICIGLISKLWLTVTCLCIIYIFSIFYTVYKNRIFKM